MTQGHLKQNVSELSNSQFISGLHSIAQEELPGELSTCISPRWHGLRCFDLYDLLSGLSLHYAWLDQPPGALCNVRLLLCHLTGGIEADAMVEAAYHAAAAGSVRLLITALFTCDRSQSLSISCLHSVYRLYSERLHVCTILRLLLQNLRTQRSQATATRNVNGRSNWGKYKSETKLSYTTRSRSL